MTKSKNNEKADAATFMVGELYRMLYTYSSMKKDILSAIEYYEKVAKNFPESSLADDSIYKIGEIYEDKLKNLTEAYSFFYRVTKDFPKGDMVSKARSKLIKLKKYAPKNEPSKDNHSYENLILVKDIKYWSEKDSTRVVIYPEESIVYKYDYVKKNVKKGKKPRIFLDLYNTRLNPKIKNVVTIKDGLLTSIRSDQNDKEIVRVVLDIESVKSYRIFNFEDPFRIVVDVSGESSVEMTRKRGDKDNKFKPITDLSNKNNNSHENKKGKEDVNYTLAKQLGLNVKKIVIDPGHGGRDPGAIGVDNIKEADIALSISRELKAVIEKNLDCQVILTRDDDHTLSLEERTGIAKKMKADLFISIHTNASEKGNIRGIETYFLNFATDERAIRTAARENATSSLALSDLEGIIKIIRYSNIQESRELANKVQKAIIDNMSKTYKGIKNLGVKQAPFYVLFGSKKPSILIEASFIDHKEEGERLKDDKYISALAESIFNGINEYIDGFELASKN